MSYRRDEMSIEHARADPESSYSNMRQEQSNLGDSTFSITRSGGNEAPRNGGCLKKIDTCLGFDQAPSEARGVVIGGSENVKSCRTSLIDSEMAGPIAMKLSGIDRGNSVTVLGQRN